MADASARHRVAVTSPPLALGTEPNAIAVLFPPVLTHLPIEALLVDGEPVGIRAAVARLTTRQRTEEQLNLAAVCLVAGANAVVAGILALSAGTQGKPGDKFQREIDIGPVCGDSGKLP